MNQKQNSSNIFSHCKIYLNFKAVRTLIGLLIYMFIVLLKCTDFAEFWDDAYYI